MDGSTSRSLRSFEYIEARVDEIVARPATDGQFYSAEARAVNDRARLVRTLRDVLKLEHPECRSCLEIAILDLGNGPRHNASVHCESGKRPHCTCDTCF